MLKKNRHILRLRRPVIPLLTKTLIIYQKMKSIYPNLLYSFKILCLRNVQNFIYVHEGVSISWRQSANFLITPPI